MFYYIPYSIDIILKSIVFNDQLFISQCRSTILNFSYLLLQKGPLNCIHRYSRWKI